MPKFLFIFVLALAFSACGGDSSHKPTSLSGTWKAVDPPMIAHISPGKIQIDIADSGGKALYWKGTLPKIAYQDSHMVSQGDIAAMAASILGSNDDTKVFTYKDGKLSFKFSILGHTKTINLKR